MACIPNNGYRYYVCLRNQPSRAHSQGKPRCDLPPAPAAPLETHVWGRIAAILLDPDHLAEGLEAARTQYTEADARRRSRLDTLDREIERLRARLQRVTAERFDAEAGSETERALKMLATETDDQIRRLRADRAELEAQPAHGLSEDEIQTLEQFAAEIRIGIEHATPVERRHIYELLRLRGTVRHDPEHGLKLGRRHHFAADWDAIIGVPHRSTEYKKVRVRYFDEALVQWEIDNLGKPAPTAWTDRVAGKEPVGANSP